MKTKDELADAIRSLPDDTPIREAIERLAFIVWLDERIAYADAHPDEAVRTPKSDDASRQVSHCVRTCDAREY